MTVYDAISFTHMTHSVSRSHQQSYQYGQTVILQGFEAVFNIFTAPNKKNTESILKKYI